MRKICDGVRPEFSKEVPDLYISLANECMKADSPGRPSANQLHKLLNNWIINEFYANIFNRANENLNKYKSKQNI
ncbi:31158_t:CDS:1, partial [Racocetra persica]